MPSFNWIWSLLIIAVVMGIVLNVINYLIMLERKLSAYMQDRIGPNRVGPYGLLQPFADGIKMFFKEDIIPKHVDKVFYLLAPPIAAATALLAFAVVPFGPTIPPPPPQVTEEAFKAAQESYAGFTQAMIAPGLDIGFLFTFSITSLAVYGIVLGGWSANNKYSLLGSLRSSAQMISYEIPLGLSIMGLVLLTGSMNIERMVQYQVDNGWNVFYQPLAFLLFMTGAFAECNRLPFDLPEAEQELVGGYHTEYSSLKFGLFFLGEYAHMITTSFLFAVLFLGGWHFPGVDITTTTGYLIGLGVLLVKWFGFILFYVMIRWTIPRFRFDQLMSMAWQVLIPLSVANLLGVMIVLEFGLSHMILPIISIMLLCSATFFAVSVSNSPVRPARIVQQTVMA